MITSNVKKIEDLFKHEILFYKEIFAKAANTSWIESFVTRNKQIIENLITVIKLKGKVAKLTKKNA